MCFIYKVLKYIYVYTPTSINQIMLEHYLLFQLKTIFYTSSNNYIPFRLHPKLFNLSNKCLGAIFSSFRASICH